MRQYALITANYWAFTLTDGALRMLVVLHFYSLGYSPLHIALLFLFYELFGVVTNLVGGYLGAWFGLNKTMNIGLALQLIALSMLLLDNSMLTVVWIMAAQALSGIAKDLNKMSAKSAIKLLAPNQKLYRWVTLLTGSKNTLKGIGFFLGGALLTSMGFHHSILVLLIGLALVWLVSLVLLQKNLGRSAHKPKLRQLLSKSTEINYLSAARLFLFASRDMWFVIALPVYLSQQLQWQHWQVSAFLAIWVIGYGLVQTLTPRITQEFNHVQQASKQAFNWITILTLIPATIAFSLLFEEHENLIIILGLCIFGVVFAINSALHSYLIVAMSTAESVSLDIGFYYMANAAGRLLGTVLSGWVYMNFGLIGCLVTASFLLIVGVILTHLLNKPLNRPFNH